MQFRLIAIASCVAIVGFTAEAAAARSLCLGESFAILHQVAYPQSDYAMGQKFGPPAFKNAVGRSAYAAYGGYISCSRNNGKVTDCLYEGR
jgi:hypothetical protein